MPRVRRKFSITETFAHSSEKTNFNSKPHIFKLLFVNAKKLLKIAIYKEKQITKSIVHRLTELSYRTSLKHLR